MSFLELDRASKELHFYEDFKAGKSYQDYFTDEERVAISKLIRHIAQPATLDLISHYL